MAIRTQRSEVASEATFASSVSNRSGLDFDASGNLILRCTAGTAIVTALANHRMLIQINGSWASTVSTTSGQLVAIANPFGETLYIVDRWLQVPTQSTGACSVSAGVAANATTSSATLMDTQSIATAGIISAAGAGGAVKRVWSSSQFVTLSVASGDSNGSVGTLCLLVSRA